MLDTVLHDDCLNVLPKVTADSVHLILSDIPYGIGVDEWDVLHSNTNSALLGSSPAQQKAGAVFQKRGKPLNGWSAADREIPRQYYEWCQTWTSHWFRVLKPGGSAIIFAGRRLAHRCVAAMEDAGFTFKDMLAWLRESAPHRAQRVSVVFERRGDEASSRRWEGWRVGNLRPVFEPILWFTKPYEIGGTIADNVLEHEIGAFHEKAFVRYAKSPDNVIRVQSDAQDGGLHPTQKPLRLMQALIELTTSPGQVVCDPFCGSGTTLIAARTLDRRYLGVEISAEYHRTAAKRLRDLEAELKQRLFPAITDCQEGIANG
ncbi:MAG: site-specific DNA-methyltransferase [Pirellulaceae bacterium]|nr:site-specific DNA-methyltransferase [Pirellulaceae bacterium]